MTRARGTSPDSELGIDGRGKLGYLMGGDPNFRTWRSKNSLVTAWLLNSMKPFIVKPNMFLPIAQNVWDSENPNDCARRMKREENDQVYMFLAGVSHNLDEVKGRILGRKPLPSIREIFSKELDSRSMIGSARECGGLYFFEDGMNSTSPEYVF
uniref:Uncharacterized protein n=1 Tax=Vitis vinifera TaxID=29760 RepID=A5AHX5_VITVI|nr:hypothetical protein VITISV_022965 [Vitis vinifera]